MGGATAPLAPHRQIQHKPARVHARPSIFSDDGSSCRRHALLPALGQRRASGKLGYGLIGIPAGDTASLLLFAGIRFSLSGLLLLAYGLATGRTVMPTRRQFGQVALLGFGQTVVQYVCYYIGLAYTTAVKASILSSSLVFFSVLLAHFIYTTTASATGACSGARFAGVVAVNFAAGRFDLKISLLGEGLLLVSTFAGSLAAIYGRTVSRQMDATAMTGWQLLLGEWR